MDTGPFTAENFMFVAVGLAALGYAASWLLGKKENSSEKTIANLRTDIESMQRRIAVLEASESQLKQQQIELTAKLNASEAEKTQLRALVRWDKLPEAVSREFEGLRALIAECWEDVNAKVAVNVVVSEQAAAQRFTELKQDVEAILGIVDRRESA